MKKKILHIIKAVSLSAIVSVLWTGFESNNTWANDLPEAKKTELICNGKCEGTHTGCLETCYKTKQINCKNNCEKNLTVCKFLCKPPEENKSPSETIPSTPMQKSTVTAKDCLGKSRGDCTAGCQWTTPLFSRGKCGLRSPSECTGLKYDSCTKKPGTCKWFPNLDPSQSFCGAIKTK